MTLLALDDAGVLDVAPVIESTRGPSTPSSPATLDAAPERAPDRFAYAPRDAVALLTPPSVPEPQLVYESRAFERTADEPPLADEEQGVDQPAFSDQEEPEVLGSWLAQIERDSGSASEGAENSTTQAEARQSYKSRLRARSYSLAKRLAEISPGASPRIAKKFEAAEAAWPPSEIALVAVKDEKILELFGRPEGGEWKFIHRYPVLAASGRAGPKLRQGDKQVPEGVYRISFLNPNSRYHVSLRVNYPNAFDREMARADGRSNLGGDIMIHGKAVSVGCLAVGDEAAEELFVLAADVGMENIKLIIAPTDFRRRGVPEVAAGQPTWLPDLYTEVATAMAEFKSPPPMGLLSFFGN